MTPPAESTIEVARTGAAVDPWGSVRGPALLTLSVMVPIVLVAGALLGEAVQPAGTYDPIGQTVSTLAGRGATDRWVMAAALAVAGVIYLVVAVGLRGMPRAGRVVLGLAGVSVIVAALAAQPAHGSSAVHMTATVIGVVALVLWPLALARDPGLDRGLRRGSMVATGVMLAMLAWLCAQAWTDGTWLGAAERVLILAQTVWPVRVAVAVWRDGTDRPRSAIGRWTLALAVLAPVVFVVGLLAAQAAQPVLDPMNQSLSALAGRGATSRWTMAGTLGLVGVVDLLVAYGLRYRVPAPAWVTLGAGGVLLLVAALNPQPVGGYSVVHMIAAGVAWAAFTLWPLGLATSPAAPPRLRWTSAAATAVLLVLMAWFTVQLITNGSWYGLSQRIVILAQSVWPILVAAALVAPRRATS